MRLIRLRDLDAEVVLGNDLYASEQAPSPLLRKGARVTEGIVRSLERRGFASVWVEDDLSAGIDIGKPTVSAETRRRVSATITKISNAVKAAERSESGIDDRTMTTVREAALAISAEIERDPYAAVALGNLAANDAYTHEHSINVTTLGLKIAAAWWGRHGYVHPETRKLTRERIDRRLTRFGAGLILHDIGKLMIDPQIINKPGALDAVEWAEIKMHPVYGDEMLAKSDVAHVARSVIRSHHERPDGQGYPDGLAGDQINQFAAFAAVADVYDAIVSDRPYQVGRPPWKAIAIIREGAGTAFTEEAVQALCQIVLPYPPGLTVEVDGQEGVVVSSSLEDPYTPLVRLRSGDTLVEQHITFDVDGSPAIDSASLAA